VIDWLADRGFPVPEEVRTAKESVVFSLPSELRRELKTTGKT
jgi:4-hydroxy-3-methylbut-2-enyl diphosphate reductase